MNCNNNRNRKPTTYTGAGYVNTNRKKQKDKPSVSYIQCLYNKAYNGDKVAINELVNIFCGKNPTRGDIYNNPTRENLQIMYEILIHSNPRYY